MNDQGQYHRGLRKSAGKTGNEAGCWNLGQVVRKMLMLLQKE